MVSLDNFWAKVDKSGSCWIWIGSKATKGYGRWNGRKAHRVAYEALVGVIPAGLTIDHLCRNRKCVNPSHMEVVTNAVNVLRGESFSAVNQRKTHCPKGHPYDETNTGHRSDRPGRICRECMRIRNRVYYRSRTASAA